VGVASWTIAASRCSPALTIRQCVPGAASSLITGSGVPYLRDVGSLARWLAASGGEVEVERLTPDVLGRFVTSPVTAQRPDGRPKLASSIVRRFRKAEAVPVRHRYHYADAGGQRADQKEILIVGRNA
jgi:hypothetical protein